MEQTEDAIGYYDSHEGVAEYLNISGDYNGAELIAVLQRHLSAQSSVLELGMGGGTDLALLTDADYHACGSDSSPLFFEHCRARYPQGDLLLLDACTIETERRFDAIYSNKVLQHLHSAELHQSLARQKSVLQPSGIALHSLWYGRGAEEMGGLYHCYYTEQDLRMIAEEHFQVIEIARYREDKDGDSLYMLLRNQQ